MSVRFGIERLRVRGFRSVRDATLRPRAVCALVGEANAGKSNLLAAVRALLDPVAPALAADDVQLLLQLLVHRVRRNHGLSQLDLLGFRLGRGLGRFLRHVWDSKSVRMVGLVYARNRHTTDGPR